MKSYKLKTPFKYRLIHSVAMYFASFLWLMLGAIYFITMPIWSTALLIYTLRNSVKNRWAYTGTMSIRNQELHVQTHSVNNRSQHKNLGKYDLTKHEVEVKR